MLYCKAFVYINVSFLNFLLQVASSLNPCKSIAERTGTMTKNLRRRTTSGSGLSAGRSRRTASGRGWLLCNSRRRAKSTDIFAAVHSYTPAGC